MKANLQDYPEVEGGTNISLRLNGYQNFNFYYREDGNGFLSGGGYTVSFLNSSGVNCYPTVIIPYSQNGNNTLGFPVFGGFNFPGTSWGVIGTFLAKIPGGGGATTPLKNATFSLGQNGSFPYKAKTNGNGYVDIYYDSTIPGNFLPYSATNYDWKISGVMSDGITKCIYTRTVPGVVDWQPPSSYLYRTDLGTVTIESQTPGCAP